MHCDDASLDILDDRSQEGIILNREEGGREDHEKNNLMQSCHAWEP